jgi:hypothetical protein
VTQLPDLSGLSHDEKDALIRALWAQVQALTARPSASASAALAFSAHGCFASDPWPLNFS